MRKLILDPVGMMDSGYEQPAPTAFARRVAKSHPWNGTEAPRRLSRSIPKWQPRDFGPLQPILHSLGVEVMRALRGNSSKLGLAPETVRSMLSSSAPDPGETGQEFVGLGWFCSGKEETFRFLARRLESWIPGHNADAAGQLAKAWL